MGFKENLQKKIDIDRMASKVIASFQKLKVGIKFDRETMRRLLEEGDYSKRHERDLDLYILKEGEERQKILVFENGLPIFHTTMDDVVMRKSPEIREMMSIRNIIKILSDGDVIVNRKEDSVNFVRRDCIDALDLAFTPAEIEEIAADGRDALAAGDGDTAFRLLTLFNELLGLRPLPEFLRFPNHKGFGETGTGRADRAFWGPLIYLQRAENRLLMVDRRITNQDRERIEALEAVIRGEAKADLEGPAVFERLCRQVIERKPVIGP